MAAIQNEIRWGIIGCGNVTEVKSGPAFNKVPGSSLVAVMRRNAAKAEDYARRHQVKKWYSNAIELINDPEVNAVYIATPPNVHEEYAIAAMKAGKPVYVEKPMSLTVASCKRMLEVSKATNVKLTVAHYRRALPMFIKIKELLNDRAIGKINTVRISMLLPDKAGMIANSEENWRVNPAISGGGIFYDLAPHQLDLVHYFCGDIIESSGYSANQAGFYEAEDVVTGTMRLQDNILFSGQWCFTTSEELKEDIFEIVGAEGKISFGVFGHEVKLVSGNTETMLQFEPPAHVQQAMIKKVTGYFLGKEEENPCSAEIAMQSMTAMERFVYGSTPLK
ncbi:MAG: oxidoreductase [Chitinophagaceae bacterium]|nr:oxidoreductase [Chitinophagaceae bacterium]